MRNKIEIYVDDIFSGDYFNCIDIYSYHFGLVEYSRYVRSNKFGFGIKKIIRK
jgi:hypothetical protein